MLFKQTKIVHVWAKLFYATTASSSSGSSGLAILRKKTGYTFANCKKALELHNNDIQKADEWLHQQAQQLGWSKATKLEGRSTKQGLVGVLIQRNIGAMIEVNCETDFVARNVNFQQFVETVSKSCLKHVQEMPSSNDALSKIEIKPDTIKNFKDEDGKTLENTLKLLIGTVGENTIIRRAIGFKIDSSLVLTGHTHPSPPPSCLDNDKDLIDNPISFQMGKYGAIVAFKVNQNAVAVEEDVQKKLCQHIIGMDPQKIGVKGLDEPNIDTDKETCLIYQEYLLDSTVTVNDILTENSLEIIDFHRYECGNYDHGQQYMSVGDKNIDINEKTANASTSN